MSKKLVFIFLLISVSFTSFAQIQGLRLLGNKKKIDVPFRYIGGFIIVDVVFADKLPLYFILDTGAENTILLKKEIADIFNLPRDKDIQILGSDLTTSIEAFISRKVSLTLSNTEKVKKDILVLEKSLTDIDQIIGTKVHGILGGDFIKGLVVKINYRKKVITLIDPDHFDNSQKSLKKYSEIDIDINKNKIYFPCTYSDTNQDHDITVLLDTGASLSALIDQATDTSLVLPEKVIPGNLGVGLGGPINGYLGRAENIKINKFDIKNLVINYQSSSVSSLFPEIGFVRNGIIGNLILQKFDLIIDYTHSKLYIKPNKNFNKKPKYDKSGLVIRATGQDLRTYIVKEVRKGSIAEEVGILPNDIIVKYKCLPTKFFSLEYLVDRFNRKEGKKVRLTLLRKGKRIKKMFRLRNLI